MVSSIPRSNCNNLQIVIIYSYMVSSIPISNSYIVSSIPRSNCNNLQLYGFKYS